MNNLTIDIFTSSVEDQELSEYKVLAALKNYANQLHRNLLYPSFSELIELWNMLHSLINQRKYLLSSRINKITGADFENQKLIYETDTEEVEDINLAKLFDFITWATPKIKEVVNEGTAIFDFVESQLSVKQIGVCPFHISEGYFIVPDQKEKLFLVFRFQLTSIYDSNVPFKTLKTNLIEKIDDNDLNITPESIKQELIKKYPNLTDPAVYSISTDLDMPFNETILPVAKRKMMRLLSA